MDEPPSIKADVVGRSCYGDRLLSAVRLVDLKVGDVLALLDICAYQEVSESNFNATPRSGIGDRRVRRRHPPRRNSRRCVFTRRGPRPSAA
jgi:hypothetical protein